MAIIPAGSTITLGGSTLVVDQINRTFTTELFDRLEFSNNRLNSAKLTNGESRVITTAFGNVPVQIIPSCVTQGAINFTPDNPDLIKYRFNIDRIDLVGGPSNSTQVGNLLTIATDHRKRLARFENHIAKASLDVSYATLITMQSETFSFITSTGISISGNPLNETLSDVLIVNYTFSPEWEVKQADGSNLLVRSWTATVEKRTISLASAS